MTRTTPPELISAERLPHVTLRKGEIYLKRQMFKVEDGSVRRLSALYAAAYADLRTQALDLADHAGLTKLGSNATTTHWRSAFLAYAQQRLATLTADVTHEAVRAASAGLTGGYYGRLWLLDVATQDDVRIQTPLLRGGDVLAALAEDVYSDLIQSLLGKEWQAQYQLEIDDLTLEIRRAIGQGALNGESVGDTMRRVADSMGVQTDRRRGAIGSVERRGYRANFNRVQTVVRTVVNRMSNVGAISAYRANSDILSGYEWLTAHDERVCPECAAMNGAFRKFSSRLQPPLHPNCRCTVIPVIKAAVLEDPKAMPRTTLAQWSAGFGMEQELADFLVPKA